MGISGARPGLIGVSNGSIDTASNAVLETVNTISQCTPSPLSLYTDAALALSSSLMTAMVS